MKIAIVSFLIAAVALPALANQTDKDFIDGMVMHHRHGIEMAEMAAAKASSEELRALGRKMADDQRREIETLTGIRGEEPQTSRPELADMPGMTAMNMGWLASKSGREFDRAFAISMIDHHLGGIKMAGMELSGGDNSRAKAVARKIRTTQRGEIRKLARHK